MPKRRKILYILIDQLRADCLNGALGDHVNMPHIRALQQDAVSFAQHYSVTNPCGPSRASIFTGRYAMNHRSVRNGTPMADGLPNLATEMRKSGYDPLLFGYTDTSLDPRSRAESDPDLHTEEGLLPGFREILEMRLMESYPWRADLLAKGYDLPEYSHFYDAISPDPDRPARPDDPPFYRAEDSDTAFLADQLLKYLSVRVDENWFALATFIRPHPPFVAPPPYNKMYKGDNLPLPDRMANPADEAAQHPFMANAPQSPGMERCVNGCDGQVDSGQDGDVQTLRALYLGLITELDSHVGRIINFLKETGQYDDTLIILSADHGEMLGDHHLWGKQHVYDPCFHVPLIIRDPQHPGQHGNVINDFSESIDVTPTILDLMGANVPAGMDGKSLGSFLRGDTPKGWKTCVQMELDYSEPDKITLAQQATGLPREQCNLAILREERFKLVHFNGGLAPLLFDLKNDPHEMRNLADDPAHTHTLLRLTQKLLSHRLSHMDQTLVDYKLGPAGASKYPRS